MKKVNKPKGMTYRKNAIYAVYRNDEIIAMGKADECAEQLKVTPKWIEEMAMPSRKKRFESRKNKERAQIAIVIDWEE